MNKLLKTLGIGVLSIFTVIGITACKTKKTTRKTTKDSSTSGSTSGRQSTLTTKQTTRKKSSKPVGSKCKINVSNSISGVTITPKINGEAIDLSKEYGAGSVLDIDIVNKANEMIRVTAFMSNLKYKSFWLDSCYDSSDPEEIKYGEIEDVELLDDLTIKVEKVDKDDVQYLALIEDEALDTETLKNEVYIYEPGTWEVPYQNGDQLVEGQKLTVVLNNRASDITILIRQAETVVKSQKYDKLETENGYTVATFTVIGGDLEGGVYIETDCGTTSHDIDARVINTMYDPTGISYKLYENGVEIASEDIIEKNSEITCVITNASSNDIIVSSYLTGGTDLEAEIISANSSKTLTKTATEGVIFAIEPYIEHCVNYSSASANVTVSVKDIDNNDITSESYVARYSKLNISITNSDSKDYAIKIKMRDDYNDTDMIDTSIILKKNSTWTPTGDFLLYGDLSIDVVTSEKFTFTINNPYDEDHADVFTSITDTELHPASGDELDYGVELGIAIMFDTTNYKVTLTNGSETILDNEKPTSTFYTISGFAVKGNVVLTISK